MEKITLGLTAPVFINGKKIIARVDTGAKYSSICKSLADELKLGEQVREVIIRSSNGVQKRPLVETEIQINGLKKKTHMTITDRSRMSFKLLIGTDLLKQGFIIDPEKK